MLYYDFLLVYVCSIQRCIPQDYNSPDPEPPISQIRTEAWSVLSIKAKVEDSKGDIQRYLDRNRPSRFADQASDRVRQIEDYRIKRPVLSL